MKSEKDKKKIEIQFVKPFITWKQKKQVR